MKSLYGIKLTNYMAYRNRVIRYLVVMLRLNIDVIFFTHQFFFVENKCLFCVKNLIEFLSHAWFDKHWIHFVRKQKKKHFFRILLYIFLLDKKQIFFCLASWKSIAKYTTIPSKKSFGHCGNQQFMVGLRILISFYGVNVLKC